MLYGTVPFKAANMSELQSIIMDAKYVLKDDISALARNLISGLLDADPNTRFGVGDILSHPWFNDCPEPEKMDMFTQQEIS